MAARITASLTFLQHILAEVLRPGDLAVDATVGNGHDTALLARLVGPSGLVHGFDVQAEAIESAGRLLAAVGLAERVRLYALGHERLAEVLPQADHGRAAAVVFNLGYLPGGDETRVTRPETTLAALEASRKILAPGGVIALACYGGHSGGAEETQAVAAWCRSLPFAGWRVARYELINKPGGPIVAFIAHKLQGGASTQNASGVSLATD
ncbi:MAG: Putative rRNA methylase [Solidesulfovibrio magneticus str. Maddingley MBC34]|uniref:Putative rRNA methylase n=1 Tax=Solidesulfovibrio magneticus str. Maddingley MBC34 TaxID=1206767 RepID=K6H8P6_9BACT|nr:MAG: Putative rRNA methylase [Solidesulfovibrio magneticus str. Maddingley MBC34]